MRTDLRRLALDAQQRVAAGEIVAHQVAGEAQAGLERVDLLGKLVAVQGHAGLQPQGIAGAEAGGHDAQRLAQFHQHFPHAQGDAGAEAQLEAVLARVAGAADDAALALGGRMEDQGLRPAVVAHRLEIDIHQRLQQFHGPRPLDGEHGPEPAHVVPNDLLPGPLRPFWGQVGVDPIDDLRPVAGIDHHEEERLAVGVVVVADQHVVEDSALGRW